MICCPCKCLPVCIACALPACLLDICTLCTLQPFSTSRHKRYLQQSTGLMCMLHSLMWCTCHPTVMEPFRPEALETDVWKTFVVVLWSFSSRCCIVYVCCRQYCCNQCLQYMGACCVVAFLQAGPVCMTCYLWLRLSDDAIADAET